jgi:hypothetical protein
MKLINTIKQLIVESEKQYYDACEKGVSINELNTLEKNYLNSLKLLNLYNRFNPNDKNYLD